MGEEKVVYPTEYMNTLANTRKTQWETDSQSGLEQIRDGQATAASFGDIPSLAAYGKVFAEVRKIYVATMKGAKDDLDAVAEGIKSSAKQMRDNDDRAGEAFVALNERWERGPLQSTQNQSAANAAPEAQEAAQTVGAADPANDAQPEDGPQEDTDTGESREEAGTGTPSESSSTDDQAPPPDEDGDEEPTEYDARSGRPQGPGYTS